MKIPEKFYKEKIKGYPVKARTVGGLIKALNELPKRLPIEQGGDKGCVVTVYNVSLGSPFLQIDDADSF